MTELNFEAIAGVTYGEETNSEREAETNAIAHSTPESGTLKEIPLANIIIKPQVRQRESFERGQQTIEELAQSIKTNGLINPIAVFDNDDGTYDLIAGERRYQAIKDYLGYQNTPVLIKDKSLRAIYLTMQLVENLQSEDLTIEETANGIIVALEKEHGYANQDLSVEERLEIRREFALKIGKSEKALGFYLKVSSVTKTHPLFNEVISKGKLLNIEQAAQIAGAINNAAKNKNKKVINYIDSVLTSMATDNFSGDKRATAKLLKDVAKGVKRVPRNTDAAQSGSPAKVRTYKAKYRTYDSVKTIKEGDTWVVSLADETKKAATKLPVSQDFAKKLIEQLTPIAEGAE